ncbi:hypothetical protein [Alkalihalobacillus sp. TS-13]|uniref:hypothetical protein n=1 Tax=Alkalihalobacillus sp. TS-13 TaxID=2842455 RepID=UPI001C868388|nr:hypothetical protein [Alkalihalobacillus sp. TS-13]
MKLIKFVFVTLLSLMLFACENSNQSTEEKNPQIKQDDINEKIKYGEQISMEKALSAVSFVPKQINRENPILDYNYALCSIKGGFSGVKESPVLLIDYGRIGLFNALQLCSFVCS